MGNTVICFYCQILREKITSVQVKHEATVEEQKLV